MLSCLAFVGCVKEIETDFNPNHNRKLVINNFFSGSNHDTFFLSYTHGVNQQVEFVDDAKIEMWLGNASIANVNNLGNGRYQVPTSTIMPENETIDFKVYRDDHLVSLSNSYKPSRIVPDSVFYELIPSPSGDDLIEFSFVFKDIFEVTQYYEVIFLSCFYDQHKDSSYIAHYHFPRQPDLVVSNEDILQYDPTTFVFSDQLFDGRKYSFRMKMEFSASEQYPIKGKYLPECDNDNYIVFRTISKEYYDFKKSWLKHRFNQVVDDNSREFDIELFFPGEPSTLYSNVSNAYGVTAGYQECIIQMKEK